MTDTTKHETELPPAHATPRSPGADADADADASGAGEDWEGLSLAAAVTGLAPDGGEAAELERTVDPLVELRLSPSVLTSTDRCARAWYYGTVRALAAWSNNPDNAEGTIMHGVLAAWAGSAGSLDPIAASPEPEERRRGGAAIAELAATCPVDPNVPVPDDAWGKLGAWLAQVADAIRRRTKWDRGVLPPPEVAESAALAAASAIRAFDAFWPVRTIEGVEEKLKIPHPTDPTIVLTGRVDLRFRARHPAGTRQGPWQRIVLDWKRVGRRPSGTTGEGRVLPDSWATLDAQCYHYAAAYHLLERPVHATYLFKVMGSSWTGRGAYQGHVVQRLDGTPTTVPGVHLAAVADRAAHLRRVHLGEVDGRRFGDCFDGAEPCRFRDLCVAERARDTTGASLAELALRMGGAGGSSRKRGTPGPGGGAGADELALAVVPSAVSAADLFAGTAGQRRQRTSEEGGGTP